MRKRRTVRVLVSPESPLKRVDLFDERGWLIKYRKITSEGLLIMSDRPFSLHRGPVEVPDVPFYRRLISEGVLFIAPPEE